MDGRSVSRRGIPVDNDECARRHLAQAQLHLDLALESLAALPALAIAPRAYSDAKLAISCLYTALRRRGRR